MKIYKTKQGIIVESADKFYLSTESNWDAYVNRDDLHEQVSKEIATLTSIAWAGDEILPPIGQQEIWASGVTYMRSREARIEESKDAGGGDFYARVYEAERPEIFFKSPASRCVGTNDFVRIRKDSAWNIPEPELTLFATSSGKIVGYTVGNDMSSRDIEGENPLYLPQAKSYDKAAAIGPCLYITEGEISQDTLISLEIIRDNVSLFEGSIAINRMKRKHKELISFLFRETTFPQGVYLMTGTGVVPPNEFTLAVGDVIKITIEGIGTLTNTVEEKS